MELIILMTDMQQSMEIDSSLSSTQHILHFLVEGLPTASIPIYLEANPIRYARSDNIHYAKLNT